jgi:hypothetical protein
MTATIQITAHGSIRAGIANNLIVQLDIDARQRTSVFKDVNNQFVTGVGGGG